MRKVVLVFCLIALLAAPLGAAGYWTTIGGKGIWIWTRANDAPRVSDGLHTWEAFRAWFLDPRAQYDLVRIGIPERHRMMLAYMVQKGLWGQRHRFRGGEVGELASTTVLRGTRLDHLTFRDGQVISPVLMGFSAEAYTISVTDRMGIRWFLHTFKVCGNAGDRQIIIEIKPPTPVPGEPPPTPVPPDEVERYYFVPPQVPVVVVNRATDHRYQVTGVFSHVANILARWLGATRIALTANGGNPVANGGNPVANGGAATANGGTVGNITTNGGAGGQGGAATVGNITTNGGAGGNVGDITNVNQNSNINPVSIGIGVNGGAGAATSTGAGSQDSR